MLQGVDIAMKWECQPLALLFLDAGNVRLARHKHTRQQKQKVTDLSFAQNSKHPSLISEFIMGMCSDTHVDVRSSTWEDPQFASPGSCAW